MPFHLWPSSGAVNRRGFLAGLALGAGGLAVARGGPRPADVDHWLALVSDVHLPSDPRQHAGPQMPAENLRVVIADILAQPRPPEGVVINGDLSLKDGRPGDYKTLLDLLGPLRKAGIPIHLVLGNHDDRGAFREAVGGTMPVESKVDGRQVGAFDALGHRFVMLDSLDKIDATPGSLGATQLAWLGRELDAHKGLPTLLFVHHNPRSKRVAGLIDGDALFEVIRPRPWVKAVVFGHTHRWTHSREAGIHLVNLPAVAYVFQPDQPLGYCRLTATSGGARVELRKVVRKGHQGPDDLSLTWRD